MLNARTILGGDGLFAVAALELDYRYPLLIGKDGDGLDEAVV